MNFTDEKDYIMRMIKEMVRVLFSLMFGKKYVSVELEKENIELKAQVEELKAYRIKWEGHLESLRAQSGVDTQKLPEKNKLAS